MSRILGNFRCELCPSRSMTERGLNSHIGRRHKGASLYLGAAWRLYRATPWRPHQ